MFTVSARESRASNKLKRNKRQAYVSRSGIDVEQRKFKPLSLCRSDCVTKISKKDQERIFKAYWEQEDCLRRVAYVTNLIKLKPKKKVRLRKNHPERNFKRFTAVNSFNTFVQKYSTHKFAELVSERQSGNQVPS